MNTPALQPQTDYLAGLGLQRAPFLDQIDDLFFYADPQLVQRLDLLQHLIQFGDMLLGVSGPAGIGKSTLLAQLLRRGAATWRSCRLNGGQIRQADDLLTQLADGFGLDRSATPERLKADLLRLFQTLRHTSLIPVVVVDDAQLLPEPALKTLLELCGDARSTLKQLRVVLFSEPGLEQRLIQTGLHSPLQPLLHNLDLPRFDDHQTAAYLMYRLAAAGYSGESPFSLTEIRALHKAADGLPGRLNVLAHETLAERAGRIAARRGAPDAKAGRGRRPVLVMGTAAGVLILGALAGYLFTRSGEESVLEAPALTESTSEESTPAPAPQPAPEAVATSATGAEPQTETTPPEAGPPASTEPADSEPADAATPAEATSGTAPALGQAPTPPASDGTPAAPAETPVSETEAPAGTISQTTAAAPEETTPAEAKPAPAAATAELPGAQTAAAVPAAQPETGAPPAAGQAPDTSPTQPESGAVTPVTAASEPSQKAESSGPPPAAAEPAAEPAAKPVAPQPLRLPEGVQQADWLLERPASHFALQLLAVRNPDSLRGFLRDYAIPEPVAVFRARLKGNDWYVLVQGDYPSMSAARAAAAELPAGVRKSKPWPRSFVSIHTDIRKTTP